MADSSNNQTISGSDSRCVDDGMMIDSDTIFGNDYSSARTAPIQESFPIDETNELPLEDDDEVYTPAEVLRQLTTAWHNEGCSPELLPHRFDLVDCILDQIHGMDRNLQMSTKRNQFKIAVHRMELDRITYLTNDYLRRRLQKIEKSAALLVDEDETRRRQGGEVQQYQQRLSSDERRYAERFVQLQQGILDECVLGQLPVSIGKLHLASIEPPTDMTERVFVQAESDTDTIIAIPDLNDIGAEHHITLERGARLLLPYASSAASLLTADICLL